MAEENPILSTDCSILSVSSEYYPTLSTYRTFCESDESLLFSIGPNTIVINENTNVNLCLNSRPRTGALWAVLKFDLNNNKCELENPGNFVKRCVMVLLDERIDKDIIVMSEDLLYNLYNSLGIKPPDWVMRADKPQVAIENTTKNNILNASKVILSLFQSEKNLENSLVDKMLQSYFSTPRFLCSGDVFSVPVERSLLLSETKVDKIYFKIVELQDIGATRLEMAGVCSAYCVNNSATIYQVPNNQDFSPPRRIAFNYKPNIYSLLCDKKLMKHLRKCNHNLLPPSFDEIFHTCCSWMDPFVCKSKRTQDIELNPLFLISGQNGTGKTLIVHALSQYFGMNYKRVDCVNVGGTVPGQAEAKLKSIFNQLKSIAPCILQLSNIEALCQDADFKEDVRLISCFEHQVKNLKSKWPIIIFATTNSRKCVSSSMNQLFLDTTTLSAPNYLQREEILSWLVSCDNETIDAKILQTVSAQTSGFLFRDLQVLVAHALKEKYKRFKGENMDCTEFVMTDFSKIIGTMHKAYSESIGAPKVPSVSWKDVGGLEPLKKEILRSLRSNAFNSGLKRSGLLLHGPPGTGKTLLAKAVATQCGRNFLSVKGPELLNMYVGQSEHNVRDLFELAKAASPCIVFFDELDSLAPNRGRSGDSGGVMDRVVSQLLAEMDDLGDSGDVFILGATNRPDLIDPALLRPGRLDKLLYVGPCEDRNSQLSVLTALTHKLHLEPDVDLQEVVSQLPASVSGAQLSALCSAAWLTSARQSIQSDQYKAKSTVAVNLNHFISAIGTIFNNQ